MRAEWYIPAALLAALAVATPFLVRGDKIRRRSLDALLAATTRNVVVLGADVSRVRLVALLCGAVALALAASGPPEAAFSDAARADRDVLVVVDTSLSMAAEDAQPSRLGAAKQTIRSLVQQAVGERIGIVAFAGSAIVQCPLTRDYSAVAMLADSLEPGVIPQPGSALRDALYEAGRAFSAEPSRARLVVLLTDGEDHASDPESMLAHLRKHDANLITVCLGSSDGAPIPLRDDEGKLIRYKRDRAGRLVSTAADPDLLATLAERAGGQFFHIEGRKSVGDALAAIARVDSEGSPSTARRGTTALACCAVVAMLVEAWAHAIGRRRNGAGYSPKKRARSSEIRAS
jgi:Ca-activated chloride channel homolog